MLNCTTCGKPKPCGHPKKYTAERTTLSVRVVMMHGWLDAVTIFYNPPGMASSVDWGTYNAGAIKLAYIILLDLYGEPIATNYAGFIAKRMLTNVPRNIVTLEEPYIHGLIFTPYHSELCIRYNTIVGEW